MAITSFRKEYFFLSNFYETPITYKGITYPTAEHAFQAAKTNNISEKLAISMAKTPSLAKRMGKNVTLRKDWNDIRLQVMTEILLIKFSNPELKKKLLDTEKEELIENNFWGDTFWGVCRGKGQNNLGKILMKIRSKINESNEKPSD